MMATKGSDEDRLFYSFNLDEHVPADHLLRPMALFLDLSEMAAINRTRRESYSGAAGWLDAVNVVCDLIHG